MQINKIVHEFSLNGVPFKLETGEIANHAQSAFLVTYGETSVLISVSVGAANPELDFFPLTVDYVEKLYAGGIISSSPYMKREGRPTDHDILSARLIDHAIRSLFPAEFRNEVQIIAQVVSYDHEHDPVLTAIIGTSFALTYSGLPYLGPYGATHIGLINNEIVLNPTLTQMPESKLEMMVSSVEAGLVSVEAEAHDISEDIVKEGIRKAIENNKLIIEEQKKFVEKYGKKEFINEELPPISLDDLYKAIDEKIHDKVIAAIYIPEKIERERSLSTIKKEVLADYEAKIEAEEVFETDINKIFEKICKKIVRANILESGKRPDGREIDVVRPLSMRVGVLPRVHGSALFTRGETQSLTIVTLGSDRDAQQIQGLDGDYSKRYFHHYNMPGYANGEVDRKFGFANRRAIGHGTIGEKALKNMIASGEEFPYTLRVVSEITSSNGSTSMAATCASTLALMDAGVPVKKVIGAIGVGLVYESNENYKVLTDIIGMEDFYGDMDFKITGSKEGITAIQLDNKMTGIPEKILFEAIDQSKEGRLFVISEMEKCLTESRTDVSKYAPRVTSLKINQDKIGELIGPGGKMIKSIIDKTGVEINIEDDGTVLIYAKPGDNYDEALGIVKAITQELIIGQSYEVEVVRVESYGGFVEIPGTKIQGLVHVSNLGMGFVKDANEVLKVGQKLNVRFDGKDEKHRVKFSVPNQEKSESNDEKTA
jgi:polyribonucleotide nucleotidyltransferase